MIDNFGKVAPCIGTIGTSKMIKFGKSKNNISTPGPGDKKHCFQMFISFRIAHVQIVKSV